MADGRSPWDGHRRTRSAVDLGLQVGRVRRDLGVHARVAGVRAADAPGDDAEETAVQDQRAAGVALAGVLAALLVAGADLAVGGVALARVRLPAVRVTQHR